MKIPVSQLTPGELEALGFQDISTRPETVEIPDGPVADQKLKPVTAQLDPTRVPEPSREVVEASMEAEKPKAQEFSPEDVTGFLVHLLGGKPFRKSYRLFGGNLQVTLQTRTASQDEAIAREIACLPEGIPVTEKLRLHSELSKTVSIYEVSLRDQPPLRPVFDLAEPLLEARQAILGELTQTTWSALQYVQLQFDSLYRGLLAKSDDESFWEAGSSN
jgi:hypothetical protein